MFWFHWKLHTKKEGKCSGRSRARRILLTCIQLLLLQFLDVIWSTPTNFPQCFQCSWNLQGIFNDDWSRGCQIYNKIYRAVFWKMRNLQAWTKLRPKPGNSSCSRSPRAIPLFFCMQFSMESNHYGMKPRFESLSGFLKYYRIVWMACYFTNFMIVKTACQNISKTLS